MLYFFAAAKDGDITSGTIAADTIEAAEAAALERAQVYHSLEETPSDEIEENLDGFHCYKMDDIFATAPELLAALIDLVKGNYGQPRAVTVPALDKARAAIAKANGQAVQS